MAEKEWVEEVKRHSDVVMEKIEKELQKLIEVQKITLKQ